MKRRPVLLLFAALCLLAVFATPAMGNYKTGLAEPWYWQQPLPQGNTIHDVEMFGSGQGTAVGAKGTILHTDDSGSNWSVDTPQGELDLYDVEYIDDQTGWIVGDRTVLKTSDAGAHWAAQSVGVSAEGRYYGIYFVTTSTAFMYGYDGTTGQPLLLRTTDGWATWQDISEHVTADWTYTLESPGVLYDAYFTSARMGWIATSSDQMLRTSNFGDTWWGFRHDAGGVLYAIAMAPSADGWPMLGWAVGPARTMVWTKDGGNHWC